MTVLLKRSAGAALAYVIASQGAWADLSAQDVWSDWQAYLSGAGYQISATENMSGDTLSISDLKMAITVAGVADSGDASFAITIPEISLTEKGDGTVSVQMPPNMALMVDGEAEGETFEVVVDYNQTGMSMIVSGAPADMNYTYTAAKNEIKLASVKVGGEMAPPGLIDVAVTLNNVMTSASMKVDGMRTVMQDMRAASMSYNVAFDDPGSDDGGMLTGEITEVGFKGGGTIPMQMDPNDVRAMLDAGFAFDGAFTFGSGKTHLEAVGDGDNVRFDSSSTGGAFRVGMNAQSLMYDLSHNGVSVEVESGEIPFPVAFGMAQAGFKILMPTAQSDEPQDVAMSLTLGDFTMSDMIWMIFDGGQVLPRDPASIIVDLSGKAKVLFDIFDTEAAMEMGMSGEQPAEINQLSINKLLISAAGAQLTGDGAFTFDNTDLASFDGIPRPEGALNLSLVGGNGLLDRLIQMGFVSQDDAMGARMMMGMVAVPGDGEDTLNSKIEVNAEGHVLANGQRLR